MKPVKSARVASPKRPRMYIPEEGDETDYHTLLEGIPEVPLRSTDTVQVADLLAWRRECVASAYAVNSLVMEQNVLESALFHANLRRHTAFTMFAHLYGSLISDLIARSDPLLRTEESQAPGRDKGKARADPIDLDSEGGGEGSSKESEDDDEDEYSVGRALAGA